MDPNHKDNLIHKADVLMEALPYIQQFRDSIAVIKFGGSAMEDPELTARTMRDIVLLEAIGMKVVVVHGGGKAITARLKELNIETRFVNGLRFTDAATIEASVRRSPASGSSAARRRSPATRSPARSPTSGSSAA